jgi:RNA 2',3'-cyclic 3'-phosphodiesterase
VRAFVAISLPGALREELAAYAADAVRDLAGRPTPAENLHATVHFLGSVGDADAARLEAALATACAGVRPFSIAIGEAALAPRRRPRMIWARLEAPAELAELARAIAAAAEPFAPGARAPRTANPHVTVARLRRPPPRSAALPPLAAAGTEVAVADCALVRSQLGRGGAQYTTLATFPLAAADAR